MTFIYQILQKYGSYLLWPLWGEPPSLSMAQTIQHDECKLKAAWFPSAGDKSNTDSAFGVEPGGGFLLITLHSAFPCVLCILLRPFHIQGRPKSSYILNLQLTQSFVN